MWISFSTFFYMFTSYLQPLHKYSVVDKLTPQGMVIVDKVPKPIAIKGFICYYICVFPFLTIYTYPHMWTTCV